MTDPALLVLAIVLALLAGRLFNAGGDSCQPYQETHQAVQRTPIILYVLCFLAMAGLLLAVAGTFDIPVGGVP